MAASILWILSPETCGSGVGIYHPHPTLSHRAVAGAIRLSSHPELPVSATAGAIRATSHPMLPVPAAAGAIRHALHPRMNGKYGGVVTAMSSTVVLAETFTGIFIDRHLAVVGGKRLSLQEKYCDEHNMDSTADSDSSDVPTRD